ncbi:MAG: GNAT family N-acetyltransferase [Pseudomonadota bacterium]
MAKPVTAIAESEADARRCFALMKQLRPHLATEDEFVARWKRQVADGYHLMILTSGDQPVALAGYRIQENLVYGRFLYVDDLVSENAARSSGYGSQLMESLKAQTRRQGCEKLVLDTALTNSLGQRFYFRNGLLATALRFSVTV